MSEGLFSAVDLGDDTARTGYRLHRVEIYNWGTFHGRVWKLGLDGDNTLLTGDIGSGKSTLVDAVTTLLLPAHKISYNKAAGAEGKERSLRSYVLGHYKSQRNESTGTTKAIGLRDHTTYSVILGEFRNEGYDEVVTLAQVFTQRDRTGQPDRFFVTAKRAMSIEEDFSRFGSDLNALRRRLRHSGAEISTSFPEYGRHVRRLLGIRSEQAMELFHQTVSMKSVGNLNEFVRDHMLEPSDSSERIGNILTHFEDLTRAHDAVRRAREQLALLDPLVSLCDRYDDVSGQRDDLDRRRESVRLFFTEHHIGLLEATSARDTGRREQLGAQLRSVLDELRDARLIEQQLIAEQARTGGDRLTELDLEHGRARDLARARRTRFDRHAALLKEAGLPEVSDAHTFAATDTRRRRLVEELTPSADRLTERLAEDTAAHKQVELASTDTREELLSLASRRSNLPRASLALRARLCDELGLDTDDLPFVGELVEVGDAYAEWRGAAERVLRGFALSLLVPQSAYPAVSAWINQHHLGAKLVYHRVPERRVPSRPAPSDQDRLVDVLDVHDGTFADYLREELGRRADHVRATSIDEFRSSRRAVTCEGQLRSGDRHEKDDRSAIDDPRHWVLGWSNERKVAALTALLTEQQAELLRLSDGITRHRHDLGQVQGRLTALGRLEEYPSFTDLDWATAEADATRAEEEKQRLLSGSSQLAELERRIAAQAETVTRLDTRKDELNGEITVLESGIGRRDTDLREQRGRVAAYDDAQLVAARGHYDAIVADLGEGLPEEPEGCDRAEADLQAGLTTRIERLQGQLNGFALNAQNQMREIRRLWPDATVEMDSDIAAAPDYRRFRERVASDDLPRFEAEFKQQLNTNTIRELAGFNNWLRREAELIHQRVDQINQSLGAIDYTRGRYIRLEASPTPNQDVRHFREELRSATDDSLVVDTDDRYSEERFLEVKRLIERFRGREGHADADKAWTRRVTDVRNWFTFSAAELDRLTDEPWEHYTDSDGKSGGQKEKLAYTILAASLAYQFGLDWGSTKSRDFRFAVIDEAFGRGSDASTRYALELFGRLGLQLLIVTPLQKVHVIEPFVRAIGFVDNREGSNSRLQTLTIEEFRARAGVVGR